MLPKFGQTKRFYELKLEIGWESDDAKQRLINAINASTDGHIKLGNLMLQLNDSARVSFPEASVLPILFKDITAIDMEDLSNIQIGNRVALVVQTDDALWAMNYEQGEPERVGSPTFETSSTTT